MASLLLLATATVTASLHLEPFDLVLHLQPADGDVAALEQRFVRECLTERRAMPE